ncbi:MAG: methyltransferase domain-containing protein [Gallionellaceae bacterium]|nr:methyltransferase domain-containing protein [Gallionellaceae bacterium]
MRTCEICSGHRLRQLHRQTFLFPGTNRTGHYDVVTCEDCGFTYASDIPSRAEQEAYYEASGRHLHAAHVPAGLAEAHRAFYDFIVANHPNLATDSAILDIGSSMGHFLNLFKSAGYRSILGLEPSSMASTLARDTYGIEVIPATLEDFHPGRQFDLITLCGVLEHLTSLHDLVSGIGRLLPDRGYLFIAVPDAASFGEREPREPFLEFALEHINFFTDQSLDNLLRPHGFERVASLSQWNDFYANRYLLALYNHGPIERPAPVRDESGTDSVARYIDMSNARLATIAGKVDALADTGTPIVIWGAGSLASRLCATTRLPECNILAFVDVNPQLHGQTLLGRPIHPPEWLDGRREATVFIASYVYGAEIRQALADKFHWGDAIVTI